MNMFEEHRKKVFDAMEDNSIMLCYGGIPVHTNEDEYYPFVVNSQFFWMTGSEHEGQALLMTKIQGELKQYFFIQEVDPSIERWTGKMPTEEDMAELSGIDTDNILFVQDLPDMLDMILTRNIVDKAYFDVFRNSIKDMTDYNGIKANEFKKLYPHIQILDLHALVCSLRQCKDDMEIKRMKEAVNITKQGLEAVMKNMKPGMMEYQIQNIFESTCKNLGAKKMAFPTIAGSGDKGCMLHYVTNDNVAEDGNLILLDLGAKYKNYCSDITRTYPVNGKFTKRQREYYDIVLKANRAVAKAAKPGIPVSDLQKLTKDILAQGLMELGKIETPEEVDKYYMHGVSHSIGIDVHDIDYRNGNLKPGWVISDEPGLYIDEEGIGIRIEDDLLITEDGCIVLSTDIIRDPDEIEKFMSKL